MKEMYWPKVSDKKKIELTNQIENLHHKSPVLSRSIEKTRAPQYKDGSISNLGANWRQTMKTSNTNRNQSQGGNPIFSGNTAASSMKTIKNDGLSTGPRSIQNSKTDKLATLKGKMGSA